jgi:hypothetical protein
MQGVTVAVFLFLLEHRKAGLAVLDDLVSGRQVDAGWFLRGGEVVEFSVLVEVIGLAFAVLVLEHHVWSPAVLDILGGFGLLNVLGCLEYNPSPSDR